ncbi:MAG: hypothetical protein IJ801_02245 [Lachnospiraceae bacterium]|nr:hypothetical protein [Lachnospiraceae bacterium]
MQKRSPDYDDVFKTMKTKHKELFIPLINEIYGTHFSKNDNIELLSSEGYLVNDITEDDEKVEKRESDFLIRIGGRTFLIECQTYEDGSMEIRIAEYAFLSARSSAAKDANGYVHFKLPEFTVLYVKSSDATPTHTKIMFDFPSGVSIPYESKNIMMNDYTKEYIIEHRLYPCIPFYIARFEKELAMGGDISQAVSDLNYFQREVTKLRLNNELDDAQYSDIIDFIRIIIRHITNGNPHEERLVSMMGGTVFKTASEKDIEYGMAQGMAQGIAALVETCRELGVTFSDTTRRVVTKFNKSESEAEELVKKYW